jgi:HEAT repeat protein/nucleoside phosphorylase
LTPLHPSRQATFTRTELLSLILLLWKRQDMEERINAFLGSYLVERSSTRAGPAYRFTHESIMDFGIALAHSADGPPILAFHAQTGLDNLLGDWVGLQEDIQAAAQKAANLTEHYDCCELLIDVIAANRGRLNDATCVHLWEIIGSCLTQNRRTRDRVAQKLGLLPRHMVQEAIAFGLLRQLGRYNAELGEIVQHKLKNGTFGAEEYQRQIRWQNRQRGKHHRGKKAKKPNRIISNQVPVNDVELANLTSVLRTHHDHARRGQAAFKLGKMNARGATEDLRGALKDEAANVRGSAANALGAIGDRGAVQPLSEALKDIDSYVRGSAANALGAIGDRAAVQPLSEALKDADDVVIGSAANALGTIGDASVMNELLNCVDSDDLSPLASAAALNAALKLTQTWPERLEDLIKSGVANTLPRPVKGKLIEGLSKFAPSNAAVGWLDKTARYERDYASRTAAVRLLEAQGQLGIGTIRFLIDTSYQRRDGRRRDTDHGVQGQTAAAVLGRFAEGEKPDLELLKLVIALLSEDNVHPSVVSAALSPLETLPIEDALRLLDYLINELASPNCPEPVQKRIQIHKEALEKKADLSQALLAAQKRPESLLATLHKSERPWFEQERSKEMSRGTAILMTANEREGRVLYETLCELNKARELPLQSAGTRFVYRCGLRCESGDERRIFLAQLGDIGPMSAQGAFSELLQALSPRIFLFVGCCGGLPEKSRKIVEGTVVVARQVFDYDRRTLQDGTTLYLEPAYRTPRQLLDFIRTLHIAGRFGGLQVLTNKDYASGSAFIDDKTASLRQDLIKKFPKDVVAVDMEGHAFLHAFWDLGTLQGDLLVGIIKGVSDVSSGDGDMDETTRQKAATRNAAQVALTILKLFPD